MGPSGEVGPCSLPSGKLRDGPSRGRLNPHMDPLSGVMFHRKAGGSQRETPQPLSSGAVPGAGLYDSALPVSHGHFHTLEGGHRGKWGAHRRDPKHMACAFVGSRCCLLLLRVPLADGFVCLFYVCICLWLGVVVKWLAC